MDTRVGSWSGHGGYHTLVVSGSGLRPDAFLTVFTTEAVHCVSRDTPNRRTLNSGSSTGGVEVFGPDPKQIPVR